MSEPAEPPSPPELAAAEAQTPRATGSSVVWMVLGVFALVGLGLAGAFFSLAYYSTKRFAGRAREAEAKMALGELSRGLQRCAEREGLLGAEVTIMGLPPSAPAVPSRLGDVGGKGYASAPSDWAHPTYACAGFTAQRPLRFQLEWVRVSPTTGTVFARGDADGDGRADDVFEMDVSCGVEPGGTAPVCTRSAAIRESHPAP